MTSTISGADGVMGTKESARLLGEDPVAWRRELHRHPEPGFGEFRTACLIHDFLQERGFHVRIAEEAMSRSAIHYLDEARVAESAGRAVLSGVDERLVERMKAGGTAVVADIGPVSGPVVAFRFDMDGLPIEESESAEHLPFVEGFGSQYSGLMHACGHDGHVAMGLGLAAELARAKDGLNAGVRLIFQPAEEGTMGGAEAIVARGLVDDVRYMICCHLGLGLPTGAIVCRSNFLATSKYRVDFHGIEAHVTNDPQSGRSALLAAAAAALGLHGIAPHSEGWFSLNVGTLRAGEAVGITPARATAEFGFWAETSRVHDYLEGRAREVIVGSAKTWGVDVEQRLIGRAPASLQSETLAAIVAECASRTSGVTEVRESAAVKGGEDGNVFLKNVANRGGHGVYIGIGSDLKGNHHTANFDIDERSLRIGVGVLCDTCLQLQQTLGESLKQ
jgi:aminobenzoyl-glutamate utilization protein A